MYQMALLKTVPVIKQLLLVSYCSTAPPYDLSGSVNHVIIEARLSLHPTTIAG
jgi:hypothetical protein